jgi:hypothetical protein
MKINYKVIKIDRHVKETIIILKIAAISQIRSPFCILMEILGASGKEKGISENKN